MEDAIGLLLLLQIFLIFLNAIFACAEIAVLSVNETKLERMAGDGNKKAKRLFKLTREPAKFLATIQVAITLSGFLGSAFAADNFSEPLVDWVISLGVRLPKASLDTIAVILITLVLSYFTLIFGELVPKRLAMKKSENIAMGISGVVSAISVIFRPIVWLLSASTNVILRLCGIDPNEVGDDVSEEEIRMMVDAGSEKGTIDTQEKEFIQNVFEFNDITAADIVIHRTEVETLWMEDNEETWKETIHKTRHTRYPICEETADNIVGILNAKDYFRLEKKDRKSVMEGAVHPAYFVPETIKADVLFRKMKENRNPLAIVLDEYGGVEGIVTLYDLIEELVGELNEDAGEPDSPEPFIERIADNTWKISGNVPLKDLEDETGLELVTEDYDTFTGLVFDELEAIPEDGDKNINIETDTLSISITKIEAHQVEEATVLVKPQINDKNDD